MQQDFEKIHKCRLCKSENFIPIINLGNQYLTGRFPSPGQEIASTPLNLISCTNCNLLQLEHSYDLSKLYGNFYGYESSLNPWMINHLKENVKYVSNQSIVKKSKKILDIGSNDGTTLNFFDKTDLLIGVDPVSLKYKDKYPSDSIIYNDFFNLNICNEIKKKYFEIDIITSFAMFYDLEDPIDFANNINSILSDNGLWCLEQSYLPSMLEKNAFDTICHEHLEYYSLKQIELIMNSSNLKVIDTKITEANGGSFLITVAKKTSNYNESKSVQKLRDFENQFFSNKNIYSEFYDRVLKIKTKLKSLINNLNNNNKNVYCLGASTKGNVILQYFDLSNKEIKAIGEVNSEKFGCVTPGTNIPIVNQEEIINDKDGYFIILPWHFKEFFSTSPKFSNLKLIYPLPEVEILE